MILRTLILLTLALMSTRLFQQHARKHTLLLSLELLLPTLLTIHLNTSLGIDQPNLSRTLVPITLRTSLPPWPCRLERLVGSQYFWRDGDAALKVEPLHIRHSLIDARDRGRIANGAFGSIPRLELDTVRTPQSNLIHVQLLRSSRMPRTDILHAGNEELHEMTSDIALSIAQTLAIGLCVQ